MAQYLIQYHNPNIEHKNNNDDNPLTLALKHHYQTNKQTIIPELIGRGVKTEAITQIERQITGGNRLHFLIREGYDLDRTNLNDLKKDELNHNAPWDTSRLKPISNERPPIIEAILYNNKQAFKFLIQHNVQLKLNCTSIFHAIVQNSAINQVDQSDLLDYTLRNTSDQQKTLLNNKSSLRFITIVIRTAPTENYIEALYQNDAFKFIRDWSQISTSRNLTLMIQNITVNTSFLNYIFISMDNAQNIIHHIIQNIPADSATKLLLHNTSAYRNYLETSYPHNLYVELIDAMPDKVLDNIYKQADFNVLHRLTQSSSANAPTTIGKIINKINNKTYTNQLSFMKLNEKKQSSMHIAAANNEQGSAILEQLVRHYPNEINRKDSGGNTPLHTACFYNHKNAALVLLQHGANPNLVNKDNRRPQLPPNLTYTSTQHQATGITTNNTYQQQGLFGGSAETSANNLPVSAENRP